MSRERPQRPLTRYTNLDEHPLPFGIFCLALIAIAVGFLTVALAVGWPWAIGLILISAFLVGLIVARRIYARRR